jgi:hypothetical protein
MNTTPNPRESKGRISGQEKRPDSVPVSANGYRLRGGTTPYYQSGGGEELRSYNSRVASRVEDKRINRDADRVLRNEDWKAPDPARSRSFTESMANPPAAVRHVVEGLLPEGICILAAQWKAGKTALVIDLSVCLLTGSNFLGRFPVNFGEDEGVGYWNLEVDEPQMFEWQKRRMMEGARVLREDPEREFKPFSHRLYTAHLRGQRIDLLHEPTREWTVEWLRSRRVKVWIIDPQGRMLDEENSSSEYNRWFGVVEGIVAEAGIRLVLIIHHSGHPGQGQADSVPRARGASSMMGNTDANLSYRHGGDLGTAPHDSLRYLSAFGRGVDVTELTVDFDNGTGELFVVEDSLGRSEDKKARKIDQLVDKAVECVRAAGDWELNNGALKAAIGGHGKDANTAIREALKAGEIISKKGDNNATLYALSVGS